MIQFATPAPSKWKRKRQQALAWLAQCGRYSTSWLNERQLRRELRRAQVELYIAERNLIHAQTEVLEFHAEVARLRSLQMEKGYSLEAEYAPNRTWIVEARDITPVVNTVLSVLTILALIAAVAFYRGLVS